MLFEREFETFLLRRYLSVHDAFDDGIYPGFLRVMVQSAPYLAAVWEVVEDFGRTVLKIKATREKTGARSAGWYLAVPPGSKRDEVSNYLAVTPDSTLAMPISVVALPKN